MEQSSPPNDISEIASLEAELIAYTGPDEIIGANAKLRDLRSKPDTAIKFASGYPGMDAALNGFASGELVVVSGPTGHGKTTWCRSLTRNIILRGGIEAVWFSYEMPMRQFLESFPSLPEFYIPNQLSSSHLKWIYRRIYEAKLKYNVRAVFIDHLHFLIDLERIKNPSLEIGALVRKLKRMAMDLNITIFLIAHLAKIKFDQEPTEADIRDSSFIAQEADAVFLIWRVRGSKSEDEEFSNESVLTIRKHRPTGVIGRKIHFIYRAGWLEELAHD